MCSEEEYENCENAQKLVVFTCNSAMGVNPDSYPPDARDALYGHRSHHVALLRKGLWIGNEMNGKILDIVYGDLSVKFIFGGNYTTMCKMCLFVKRNLALRWIGDSESSENWIDFDEGDLGKVYSYFNIPAFGGKTSQGSSHTGWKRLQALPWLLGGIIVRIADLQNDKLLLRRLSKEVFIKNGRYDITPQQVAKQISKYKWQPGAAKNIANQIYIGLNQIRCGIVNLVCTKILNYKDGKVNYEKQWPILPNLICPKTALYRIGSCDDLTKKNK